MIFFFRDLRSILHISKYRSFSFQTGRGRKRVDPHGVYPVIRNFIEIRSGFRSAAAVKHLDDPVFIKRKIGSVSKLYFRENTDRMGSIPSVQILIPWSKDRGHSPMLSASDQKLLGPIPVYIIKGVIYILLMGADLHTDMLSKAAFIKL